MVEMLAMTISAYLRAWAMVIEVCDPMDGS